ncbi:MAG: hypothetical protein KC713_05785 [Candidatus Omnitrophica bacterium]|nr:hypothetical protein [Candidatus Omnitrophota bacterium]
MNEDIENQMIQTKMIVFLTFCFFTALLFWLMNLQKMPNTQLAEVESPAGEEEVVEEIVHIINVEGEQEGQDAQAVGDDGQAGDKIVIEETAEGVEEREVSAEEGIQVAEAVVDQSQPVQSEIEDALSEMQVGEALDEMQKIVEETEAFVAKTGLLEKVQQKQTQELDETVFKDDAISEPTPENTGEIMVEDDEEIFEMMPKSGPEREYPGLVGALGKVPAHQLIQQKPPQKQEVSKVQTCKMKNLGVQFTCNLSWKVINEESGDGVIVLSDDPLVTLTWKQMEHKIRFLGQLNTMFFEKLGAYENGFRTEKVDFAGFQAVMVKGYTNGQSDAQVRDFYFVKDDQLVNVSFSLSPKERWDDGKFLIEEVRNTFAKLTD